MGYEFFELHDDRIRKEGRKEGLAEGLTQGRAEGLTQGRAEGMLLLEEAADYLTAKGRTADIPKLLIDQDFRESVLKDLGRS